MTKFRFVLQFPSSQTDRLAARYLEQDLQIIFRWKTGGRGISRNTDQEIADVLQLAAGRHGEVAIAVLCGLNGVEVSGASAILTAINPERFTIIDFRALEALGISERQTSYSIDSYIDSYGHVEN